MALAVMLGAFGAHILRDALPPDDMETFQTGVFYHFVHTLGIIGVIGFSKKLRSSQIKTAAILFFLGIGFFSFSLYTYTITLAATGIRHTWMGAITPVGGTLFIAGWLYLAFVTLKTSAKNYISES